MAWVWDPRINGYVNDNPGGSDGQLGVGTSPPDPTVRDPNKPPDQGQVSGPVSGGGGNDPYHDYNGGSPPDAPLQAGRGWVWEDKTWRQAEGKGLGYNAPAAPRPSGGGGSYSGGGGSGFQSNMGNFGQGDYGDVPEFGAPRWEAPPEFVYNKQFAAPDEAKMKEDPGFQFRLDQGRKALEASAAGKGILRTGGTLKDLVNYGQNFATNEYANVYNRNFNEYKFDYDKEADIYARNYNLKRDVFDRNYKAAYDEYAPKLTGWQTNTNNKARAQEALFNREWQMYLGNQNADLERRRIEQGDVK
jgi:hypothetical protein